MKSFFVLFMYKVSRVYGNLYVSPSTWSVLSRFLPRKAGKKLPAVLSFLVSVLRFPLISDSRGSWPLCWAWRSLEWTFTSSRTTFETIYRRTGRCTLRWASSVFATWSFAGTSRSTCSLRLVFLAAGGCRWVDHQNLFNYKPFERNGCSCM